MPLLRDEMMGEDEGCDQRDAQDTRMHAHVGASYGRFGRVSVHAPREWPLQRAEPLKEQKLPYNTAPVKQLMPFLPLRFS